MTRQAFVLENHRHIDLRPQRVGKRFNDRRLPGGRSIELARPSHNDGSKPIVIAGQGFDLVDHHAKGFCFGGRTLDQAPGRCERRGRITQRETNPSGAIVDAQHSHAHQYNLAVLKGLGAGVQWCTVLGCLVLGCLPLLAQDARTQAARIDARIKSLQKESDSLAAEARTVFGELRKLELDREIKKQEVEKADLELAQVTVARDRAEARVSELEAKRIAQTPAIKERLVELSKRGRSGYVQLLLASNDVRAIGRMARGVAAVAELDRVRLETHRRTLEAERDALNELDQQRDAVEQLQRDATRARAAVDAAVTARNRLIDQLDQQRDLAAQYVAELQQAQLALDRTLATTEASSAVIALPIRPFKGDLPWPIDGPVTARFGRIPAGRFGTTIVRNGIELAAKDGDVARAVHEGTVAFAAPFSGFGTMVIVDHGASAFTLYGNLLDATVNVGTNVSRGTPLGRVGLAPSGGAALYFEVRIDGRPVNPLEWLKGRRSTQ